MQESTEATEVDVVSEFLKVLRQGIRLHAYRNGTVIHPTHLLTLGKRDEERIEKGLRTYIGARSVSHGIRYKYRLFRIASDAFELNYPYQPWSPQLKPLQPTTRQDQKGAQAFFDSFVEGVADKLLTILLSRYHNGGEMVAYRSINLLRCTKKSRNSSSTHFTASCRSVLAIRPSSRRSRSRTLRTRSRASGLRSNRYSTEHPATRGSEP